MNEEQVKGGIDEVKGNMKKVVGKAVGSPSLERKGKIQNAKGKSQMVLGNLREEIKKSL
jgi:uncharacterized protein YjbJ (UPF0337 family)